MRIAVHQPRASYFVGGGEIVALEQAKGLCKRNEVSIMTNGNMPQSDYFIEFCKQNSDVKIEYFEVPKNVLASNPGHDQLRWDIESIAFGRITEDFYKKNAFDLVVTHYSTDGVSLPKNSPNILHLHGFPHYYSDFYARNVQCPKGFIAVADFVNSEWVKEYGLPKEKVITVTNGIDDKLFVPKETDKKYDVGYVGRLIEIKGIEYLLYAIEEISRHIPNIKAVIAGTGPDEKRLKSITSQLRIENNVDFIGYLPEENKVEFYNEASILCFPSYAREGVLTTMLEAASCARPIITANCCGMVEFLKDGHNGLLADPKDYKSLSFQLSKLIFDQELSKKLGRTAREDIMHSWTWEKKIDELEAAYKRLLGAEM